MTFLYLIYKLLTFIIYWEFQWKFLVIVYINVQTRSTIFTLTAEIITFCALHKDCTVQNGEGKMFSKIISQILKIL